MKERGQLKKGAIWRLIYPYLVIYGANLIVGFVLGVIYCYGVIEEKGIEFFANISTDKELLQEMYSGLSVFLTENSVYYELAFSLITIPLMLLFLNMDKKRLYRDGDFITYDRPKVPGLVAAVILGMFAAITLNNILSISGIVELFYEKYSAVSEIIYSGGILVEIITIVILAPVTEELVFRGLIFKRMREVAGPVLSMVLSSLLFAYFHGNIVQGIYAFGMGMLLAFVMERFQSIWACICLHMGANAVSLLLTESKEIKNLLNNNTFVIIYIVAGALGVIFSLWYIYEKIHPVVLIPSVNQQNAGENSREE